MERWWTQGNQNHINQLIQDVTGEQKTRCECSGSRIWSHSQPSERKIFLQIQIQNVCWPKWAQKLSSFQPKKLIDDLWEKNRNVSNEVDSYVLLKSYLWVCTLKIRQNYDICSRNQTEILKILCFCGVFVNTNLQSLNSKRFSLNSNSELIPLVFPVTSWEDVLFIISITSFSFPNKHSHMQLKTSSCANCRKTTDVIVHLVTLKTQAPWIKIP